MPEYRITFLINDSQSISQSFGASSTYNAYVTAGTIMENHPSKPPSGELQELDSKGGWTTRQIVITEEAIALRIGDEAYRLYHPDSNPQVHESE